MKLEQRAAGRIRVVHVPKTIDNDLDLPPHVDTFGFQTARHFGVDIVKNLMVDAQDHVALVLRHRDGPQGGPPRARHRQGGRRDAHAHPGGVPRRTIRPARPSWTRSSARSSSGSPTGVATASPSSPKGSSSTSRPATWTASASVERDAHGHLRIAEVNLGEILKSQVQKRLGELGIKTTIVAKNIGYELRCADPIPFDMEYTRDLGYCAAKYLLAGGNGAMISMQGGHFVPVPFRTCSTRDRPRARPPGRHHLDALRDRPPLHDPAARATTSTTRTSWPSSRRRRISQKTNSGGSSSTSWLKSRRRFVFDEKGEHVV